MRKLIRVAAVAFLVWAITTFAWAALSHITGVTGPAEASGESLNFVASAVTFVDPPGVLGAPQRFAARQLRQAADAIERVHHGPERLAAQLVDELGHRHRHGRHVERHVIRIREVHSDGHDRHRAAERALRALERSRRSIPLDRLDRSRADVEARARVELERHRSRLERDRERLEIRRELTERQRERIQRSMERVYERFERAQAEEDGELRRKLEEKLREILRELEKELGEVNEIQVDLHAIEMDDELGMFEVEVRHDDERVNVEGPVRIRIRDRKR